MSEGSTTEDVFPVVSLGASAGGTDAIVGLLSKLKLERLAVVVVQHQPVDSKVALSGVLSRATGLNVLDAVDGAAVRPGQVYVASPQAELALLHGTLQLMTLPPEAARLPIDYFMRALAADLGPRAVGVVLSGTGSDGTFGLEAIKQAGGITFAQDPASAAHGDMPRSASESGFADFTLPIEGIAAELDALAAQPPSARDRFPTSYKQEHLGKLIVLIRAAFGNDLTYYKPSTIERRIERRMSLHKIDRLEDYVRFVSGNSDELKLLYKDMLIGVTSFFRDPETFEALAHTVYPQLVENKQPGSQIRIWVPACSTGEEAYSYAMSLVEFLGDRALDYRIQIFGTDVDETSVATARRGVYPGNIALDVSAGRLHRFFIKKDHGYQVSRRIRDMVVFSVQNVTKDPPFSRLDVASCRNLLIYLQPQMQSRVLRVLHYALQPNGALVLGTSETVGEASDLFTLVDRTAKIYVKKLASKVAPLELGAGLANEPRRLPAQALTHRANTSISMLAERKILELYGPPGVVINDDLDVVHIRGRTGPFLEPMPGAPSFNILKLARPQIHVDLRRAIHEAETTGRRVSVETRVTDHDGVRNVRIEVVPINDPATRARSMMVLFQEPQADGAVRLDPARPTDTAAPEAQRATELEREMMVTREYLQSTIEELESGSEELKSSNEELQSSNEELQSTNEELETSKEELQSANEELTTVNDELQTRMVELQQSNDDLYNVLASVGNAVVIVGMDLRMRRYTQSAEKLLNLVPADVGRSVSHLNAFVQGARVEALAAEVVSRMIPKTAEVLGADGRWYELGISPYRSLDHSIKGALVVLTDIDAKKRSDGLARDLAEQADGLYRVITHALAIVDARRRVRWVNAAFARRFSLARQDAVGQQLSRFIDEAALEAQLARAANDGVDFKDVAVKDVRVSGSRISPIGGESPLVLLSFDQFGGNT
ncbi:MAG: PAS domain-containing protein [Archangiaceae bacterium]|nr:PAS domain-containing protein [Archangiaceae bacterium]